MEVWIASLLICFAVLVGIWLSVRRAAQENDGILALRAALEARLREIQKEVDDGLTSADEAKLARAEVGRRLLSIADQSEREHSADDQRERRAGTIAIYGSMVLMPIAAFAVYASIGKADYPDQPMFARLEAQPAQQSADELLARVEQHLANDPTDVRGWSLVAPVYRRIGRFDDAVHAWTQVLRYSNPDPKKRSDLLAEIAEARVIQAEGLVSAEAVATFERALELNQMNGKAGYYKALSVEQTGEREAGQQAWQELIDLHAEENPAWLKAARDRLAALSGTEAPGPTREDVEAAQSLSANERMEMIRGMVDGLEARLKDDPNDADGWLRLIRSRTVLGDKREALAALTTARDNFAEGTEARTRLDAIAKQLKLEEASND